MSSRLDALPDELLLDNILPLLEIPDLLSISQTNHHIRSVSSDSTFWKRKIRTDFNLPPSVTARQDGWKELYAALRRPSLHVWGATSNSRLGLPRSHPALSHHSSIDVNRPAHLALDPAVGLVDLQASGFGFVGLDSKGHVWIWGALDGTQYISRSNPNWMHAGSISPGPRQLALSDIESVVCGRKHFACLDKDGTTWELTAWGKARKLKTDSSVFIPSKPFSSLLESFEERFVYSSPFAPEYSPISVELSSPIAQISAGWSHTAALSQSGQEVLVWHPSFANRPGHNNLDVQNVVHSDKDGHIPVSVLQDSPEPFILPPLPSDDEGDPGRIVTIASGEHAVLALTEHGRIWSCWVGTKVSEIGSLETGESQAFWEEHPKFRHPRSEEGGKITHISAQFSNFFAYSPGSADSEPPYSTSLVLKGSHDQLRFSRADGAEPEIIPELQGRGVTKVALGDWHFAALTVRGEVLTWGQYCDGSLGLGDLGKGEGGVAKPTLVRFGGEDEETGGEEEKRFAFALTASGWHTGALTVDLRSPPTPDPASTSSASPTPSASFHNPTSARMAQLDPPPSGRPIPGGSLHPSVDASASEGGGSNARMAGQYGTGLVGLLTRGLRIGFAGRGGSVQPHQGSGGARGGLGRGSGQGDSI